jgi:hypothetical protein
MYPKKADLQRKNGADTRFCGSLHGFVKGHKLNGIPVIPPRVYRETLGSDGKTGAAVASAFTRTGQHFVNNDNIFEKYFTPLEPSRISQAGDKYISFSIINAILRPLRCCASFFRFSAAKRAVTSG